MWLFCLVLFLLNPQNVFFFRFVAFKYLKIRGLIRLNARHMFPLYNSSVAFELKTLGGPNQI